MKALIFFLLLPILETHELPFDNEDGDIDSDPLLMSKEAAAAAQEHGGLLLTGDGAVVMKQPVLVMVSDGESGHLYQILAMRGFNSKVLLRAPRQPLIGGCDSIKTAIAELLPLQQQPNSSSSFSNNGNSKSETAMYFMLGLGETELQEGTLNLTTEIVEDLLRCVKKNQPSTEVLLFGPSCDTYAAGTGGGSISRTGPAGVTASMQNGCITRSYLTELLLELGTRNNVSGVADIISTNLSPDLMRVLQDFQRHRLYLIQQTRYRRERMAFTPSIAASLFLMPLLLLAAARAVRIRAQMLAAEHAAQMEAHFRVHFPH